MERETLTTAANEVWNPVKGYEGYYEVSNHGRIRSLDRVINNPLVGQYFKIGRILKLRCSGGYLNVMFSIDGVKRVFLVHRIVAESFIPNPDNLPYVNHKDENKNNNHVDNLEWCTAQYNTTYGTCKERSSAKLRKKIGKYTISGCFVASFNGLKEAAKSIAKPNGWSQIAEAARSRRQKTAFGYKWIYI